MGALCPLLLFWGQIFLLLLSLGLESGALTAKDPRYFGGVVFQPRKSCTADQTANCQKLCPDNNLASCLALRNTLAECYCHSPPATVDGFSCSKKSTTAPGDTTKTSGTKSLTTLCEDGSKQDFRSKVDVYVCRGSPNVCVAKDYLEDIETTVPFGGKTVDNICGLTLENFCKDFCPGTFASCGGTGGSALICYCHTEPPTNARNFICTKTETITPSDVTSGGSSTEDQCHDAAVGFTENIDLYICKNPKVATPACMLLDKLPVPTTTTTTTEIPTSTTTSTSTTEMSTSTTESGDSGLTSMGNGNGNGNSCSICKGGFFLSFIVCPILCIVFRIIRFVLTLLSKTLFQTLSKLLRFVTSTVDGVLGTIGGLLD